MSDCWHRREARLWSLSKFLEAVIGNDEDEGTSEYTSNYRRNVRTTLASVISPSRSEREEIWAHFLPPGESVGEFVAVSTSAVSSV